MSNEDDSQTKLEKLIEKAMANAESDRAELNKFIANLLKESISRPNTAKDEFGNKIEVLKNHELAPLLVKQYETKIKANEQLIKLANILQKDRVTRSREDDSLLESFDPDDLYEDIENEEHVLKFSKEE